MALFSCSRACRRKAWRASGPGTVVQSLFPASLGDHFKRGRFPAPLAFDGSFASARRFAAELLKPIVYGTGFELRCLVLHRTRDDTFDCGTSLPLPRADPVAAGCLRSVNVRREALGPTPTTCMNGVNYPLPCCFVYVGPGSLSASEFRIGSACGSACRRPRLARPQAVVPERGLLFRVRSEGRRSADGRGVRILAGYAIYIVLASSSCTGCRECSPPRCRAEPSSSSAKVRCKFCCCMVGCCSRSMVPCSPICPVGTNPGFTW